MSGGNSRHREFACVSPPLSVAEVEAVAGEESIIETDRDTFPLQRVPRAGSNRVDVQVWFGGVPGISDLAEELAGHHAGPGLDDETALLEVGDVDIDRRTGVDAPDDHVITGRILPIRGGGSEIGEVGTTLDDRSAAGAMHVTTEDGVATVVGGGDPPSA